MQYYGNPNAKVSCTYKEFFEEVMNLVPKLKYTPQNQLALHDILTEASVQAFLKEEKAPLVKEVFVTFRRFGEVHFKP